MKESSIKNYIYVCEINTKTTILIMCCENITLKNFPKLREHNVEVEIKKVTCLETEMERFLKILRELLVEKRREKRFIGSSKFFVDVLGKIFIYLKNNKIFF